MNVPQAADSLFCKGNGRLYLLTISLSADLSDNSGSYGQTQTDVRNHNVQIFVSLRLLKSLCETMTQDDSNLKDT